MLKKAVCAISVLSAGCVTIEQPGPCVPWPSPAAVPARTPCGNAVEIAPPPVRLERPLPEPAPVPVTPPPPSGPFSRPVEAPVIRGAHSTGWYASEGAPRTWISGPAW